MDCANPPCPLANRCLLKSALDRAQAAFFDEMERYTLADLATAPALQTLVLLSA